tara:strand:- start:802 stop:1185 length:384 start_codon:yes stop_codon:yes gene_type:complete
MSFSTRLVIFIFGIIIGVFLIGLIFSNEKISKIKKGYIDYFKGHDKVITFLLYQTDLKNQIESYLNLSEKDSIFYEDFIKSSEIEILSRKPCFQYLLKAHNQNFIKELLIEKCDEKVSLVNLELKKD